MKIVEGEIGCRVVADRGEELGQCDPARITSLLRQCGWVFFSGFEPSLGEFEAFSSRFGACQASRTVHYPPGGVGLGFHAEDAYNPYRPDVVWFFCLFEGTDGGVPTIAVDGVRIFRRMAEEWQNFCRSNRLRFERLWSADAWLEVVQREDRRALTEILGPIPNLVHRFLPDDTLYVRFDAPLVVRTPKGEESFSNSLISASVDPEFYGMSLANGSPVPGELGAGVSELAREGELYLGWAAGDLVVVDNYRMMHRRGEYHGSDRDLRARHGEDFFGSVLPPADSPLSAWAKQLLQGDGAHALRVGPFDEEEIS